MDKVIAYRELSCGALYRVETDGGTVVLTFELGGQVLPVEMTPREADLLISTLSFKVGEVLKENKRKE